MIELKDKKMSNERDLKGLKGWLILVGIGLVVSPIRLLIQLIPSRAFLSSASTGLSPSQIRSSAR